MKRNLLTLAEENVELCLKIISIHPNYTGTLESYRSSSLTALSSLLEALSGIFCELTRLQPGEEPTVSLDTDNYGNLNPLAKAGRYLQAYSVLLEERKKRAETRLPYTAMFVEAQTLMFEIREYAKSGMEGPTPAQEPD